MGGGLRPHRRGLHCERGFYRVPTYTLDKQVYWNTWSSSWTTLVIRDNRVANKDSFHLRLCIWKENQAETATKNNARNKTKSGQSVEEAKTWLEEMGLSSRLQKQQEEGGEEEKRGKKRERKTKKKKPWEPRKRRDAMTSKRKVVVELECSVDLPQLSLTIALNYVGCNIVQEPLL